MQAAPSQHPSSKRYRWGPGLRPDEIENAPLPPWLVRHSEYESGEVDSIVNAAWRGDRSLVAAALRGGISPDAPAPDGYTALQRAVWGGHTACVELLLWGRSDRWTLANSLVATNGAFHFDWIQSSASRGGGPM